MAPSAVSRASGLSTALVGAILLGTVLAGCDSGGPLDEPRVYAFDLVEAQTGTPAPTTEACAAAQPDPDSYVNCWQTLLLCPDGRAEFVLTDIINGGTYRAGGRTVDVTFEDPGDAGDRARFVLSADGQAAVFEATGETWARWADDDERAAPMLSRCR